MATSLSISILLLAHSLGPQTPTPPVPIAVGYGVDTVSAPNHEIFLLWSHYLASRPSCGTSPAEWSAAERTKWPSVDLLCGYAYVGERSFTIVNLEPAVGMDSTYFIRTLAGSVGDSGADYYPLALYRTYAVRENGRWVLANALPRETRTWRRERIGRITFVFPMDHVFARARAEGSARFVDSLARAWSIAAPAGIDYYFTDNPKDTQRAMGLDFIPAPDTTWGMADTRHDMVFVGSSRMGEDYRHEIAHLVLIPFEQAHPPARLVAEGLATWAGGSAGLRFRELMPALAHYLSVHYSLTLAQIMADPPRREGALDVGYDGFAALCELVYARGGLPGITALADAGRDPRAVLDAAARVIGVTRGELDEVWRARVDALAR